MQSDPAAAAAQLREFVDRHPLSADAYRLLASADRVVAASQVSTGVVQSSVVSGAQMRLQHATRALDADDLEPAEIILRQRLHQAPGDVEALRLMATLATRLDYHAEAEKLLRLALELAPDYLPARFDLASTFDRRNRPLEAVALMDEALTIDPHNQFAQAIKATALGRAGRYDESLALYERLLERAENEPKIWTSYGLMLKTVGRSEQGRQAMRRAVAIEPATGEAWWELANLKTERFGSADIATMSAVLQGGDASEHDNLHIHFALGKAFEDAADPERAFAHYADGNRLRQNMLSHDPDEVSAEVKASQRFFSRDFFERRADQGSPARDPIFIVGMPRSGSTLVEQILASHSQIEGTTELPDIGFIARRIGRRQGAYFSKLAKLTPAELRALGETYLANTRAHRVEGRPLFIDKMPNNWVHVPLIHLILPNAKIIDARRHPMACGFSNFKQHFARGQAFSYDLTWMGRYYADYVRMMAHVDRVLPGRVHRVIHEDLVANTEEEIRRLIDYLGLPFEDSVLRFYENERAVRTPSSEQVRQPVNPRGLDQWRPFEPWLEPLKRALGDVLDHYPAAPGTPEG